MLIVQIAPTRLELRIESFIFGSHLLKRVGHNFTREPECNYVISPEGNEDLKSTFHSSDQRESNYGRLFNINTARVQFVAG
jgi:hypothetical protein